MLTLYPGACFAQVATSAGGQVHTALRLHTDGHGIGLAAGTAVQKGEVLVRLPAQLQLTENSDAPPQLTGKSNMLSVYSPDVSSHSCGKVLTLCWGRMGITAVQT